jgi:hypothetical protein
MVNQEIRTSPKKWRTPNANTRQLWDAILEVMDEYDRMSVRQLFYQLVSRGHIDKTEHGYKRVCDATVQIRLAGELPYHKVVDGHRERRRTFAHNGLHQALESAADMYRRNYWITQPRHIEVWSEKDALSGVIFPICEHYGVTYVAARGFPSLSIRYQSSKEFLRIGKPVTVFYFGDHDASGRKISDNLQEELAQFGADVTVVRMALEPQQIRDYRLPTRPGKRSDSRHAEFASRYGDASVELDALPPDVLTSLVENAILSEIDLDAWKRMHEVEQLERRTLASLANVEWEPGAEYGIA